MSVPKQRHSNRRQARGRTRYVKTVKNLSSCPACSASTLSHRACPSCGSYRGRRTTSTPPPLPKTKEKGLPVAARAARKKK